MLKQTAVFAIILFLSVMFSCKAAKNGQQTSTSEPQLGVESQPSQKADAVEKGAVKEDVAEEQGEMLAGRDELPAAPVRQEEAVEAAGTDMAEVPVDVEQEEHADSGTDLVSEGREDAEPDKEAAVERDDPGEYFKLGVSYSNEGKYLEAIDAYKKAERIIKSDYVIVHYNLGLTYLIIDDTESALKEYRILKSIDPHMAGNLYDNAVQQALSDENNKYVLQIGAYKNIEYANEIFEKLKSEFICAYIEKENDFNKVRIPGIKTKKESVAISKEIHKKYGLEPFLINADYASAVKTDS